MTKEPEDILAKLPKKTPQWAIGVVAILVAIVTAFSTVYLLSRDDIRQYVGWYQEHRSKTEAGLEARYTMTLNAVLSLVDTNSKQITELSKSLGVAQQQNSALAERVSQLEKNLAMATMNLQTCETKLTICRGK